METLGEAIDRLRVLGYTQDWMAESGVLRCGACGTVVDPGEVSVDHIVRFEGTSDPGDEAILFALSSGHSHHGLYSVAYGPETPPDDIVVIAALPDRVR